MRPEGKKVLPWVGREGKQGERAKLKVDSLEQIREKLAAAGAKFLEDQVQTDIYFDDADGTLTKTDKCLRLRCQGVCLPIQNASGIRILVSGQF